MSENNDNISKKRKVFNNNTSRNRGPFPFTTQLLDFWLVRICEHKRLGALFVKSILSFINVFEYYHCEKTLSGPNTPDSHTDEVSSVLSFQDPSNGKMKFVSGSYDETIKVWDYVSGQCDKTLSGLNTPDRHTNSVFSVSAFQDIKTGRTKFVSGSYDKTIKIWG